MLAYMKHPFYTFADAHDIEEEIPLVLVLIADAAQLRMRLQRAPVFRVADPDSIGSADPDPGGQK
jgi:hypothetical protein